MEDTAISVEARLFHVEDAAAILSIGRTKAYELIAAGQLHAIHIGRVTRISGREIDRFVRSLDRPEHSDRSENVRPAAGGERTVFDAELSETG